LRAKERAGENPRVTGESHVLPATGGGERNLSIRETVVAAALLPLLAEARDEPAPGGVTGTSTAATTGLDDGVDWFAPTMPGVDLGG